VLDVGIVGLGAWGLCVLERTIRCARSTKHPIRVHAVEPGVIGGSQYDPAQPDYLILNNACGQLSLYANPDDGPHPRYGLSLFEWASGCGYQWFGHECRIATGGVPVQPGDYLPRRLMGEYLAWFYATALEELPANLQFTRYRSAVLDITPAAGDREQLMLADGTSVLVNHVVLTSGHTPNRESMARPGEVVGMQPYPVTQLETSPAPGKTVAVSGMGLVAYDVITALTIGRGGRFSDSADRMIYRPTGREPRISLYSRSGVPYCAKSASGIDPTGEYRPVVCTPEVFAAIRGMGDGRLPRRPVDLRHELLPLLFTEMRARYYIHAATLEGGAAAAGRVRSQLQQAWIAGRFDDATSALSLRHGSFDPETHVFAGENRSYASAADYQKQFYAMVESDLDEAVMPAGSPVKAAQEVLRILRDEIRSIIEFGGLSLDSHLDFTRNVKGRINRLEAGPPALRSQQLLALMDAGIVEVPFGPAPMVSADSAGRVVIESTHLDIPYLATATSVIRGHLEMPSLANSASPLLARLYRRGRLTQLRYGQTPVGSVAISDDFHPYDTEGRIQRNISVFGVLTEGSRYFTHYLPSPRSRIRAVLDAQACIERLVAVA
jgi:uncharacterized NAD(P)/FAD-binding protein YdhS